MAKDGKIKLNEEQKGVFKALQKFIEHPAADTFVLKGYAGTGKTFLMQHFAKWLQEQKHAFSLLASTGRAATVLRGKTGLAATTVHGELYRFNKVDGDEEEIPDDAPVDKYGQMVLQFRLRAPDHEKRIYIVDESSMLASELGLDQEIVAFGSGELLQDFFGAVGTNKIVFVGDPGQLPPISQLFSPALDMDWLVEQKRTAISMTLQKMERHTPGNDILVLASNIRSLVPDPAVSYPKIPARSLNNVKIYSSEEDLLKEYLLKYKEVGANGTLAITRSNKKVKEINDIVREDLFGSPDKPVQVGDILMVVQNNYAVPLTNGDFVEVTGLGEVRTKANLHFQSIRVKALLSEFDHEMLISLDVLYGPNSNFTKEQWRDLMIDFSRRMKKKKIKSNSPVYKKEMLKDEYINCLRAKYGYAVTCHKAQGGEWDDVYLFLNSKMYGMPHEELFRWWYTAITRAKSYLHVNDGFWIR